MDMDIQIQLEELFYKNQMMRRLRQEVQATEGMAELCQDAGLSEAFVVDLLVQMELHKRADVSTLVGILHRHFEAEADPFQTCADALAIAVDFGLVDWDSFDRRFVVLTSLDPEIQAEIDQFQYPLPMIVPPKVLEKNTDTGLFSELCAKGSLILKDNHHEDDICLDHLNRVNATPLTVNAEVVRLIQNNWADLDKKREGESDLDLKRRQAAFAKYDRVSRDVIESVVVFDAPIYLTHKYDKRGRTYAQGYHVNPQGNAWNKAVVEFAQKELIG